MKVPAEMVKIVGLFLGVVAVLVLSQYIFPNDLAKTTLAIMAGP